ncbi:Fc receptor-like protein 5 isoform X2 [Brienomyrus brachyistius]|uniref:Fc receptor-like protein 5 isoform X2 n=1 Tax=Brienomyrus brachyistius TaxID=42636 RepID=UPI0020B26118|nr:Fc receptor-like protein 5 isoform X2 [Brienomyrus brachyistius]
MVRFTGWTKWKYHFKLYFCIVAVLLRECETLLSEKMSLDVHLPTDVWLIPEVILIATPTHLLVEGDALNLTCIDTVIESSNSTLVYIILRDNHTVSRSTGSRSFSFFIPSVAKSDAGWYNCSVTDPLRLQRYSGGIQVTVEDLFQKVVLLSTHEGALIMEKEPQTLHCVAFIHKLRATHTNVTYVFLKAGQPIASSSAPVFHIASIERSNAGSYSCMARSGTAVGRSPEVYLELYEHIPKPTLMAKPPSGRVYTEDQIVLKCKLDAFAGWTYNWYKDRKEAYPVEQNWGSKGVGAKYIIWRASLEHTGQYWCRAGRGSPVFYTDYSEPLFINVTAKLISEVILIATPTHLLVEGDALNLTCAATTTEGPIPTLDYTILKNNHTLSRSTGSRSFSVIIPTVAESDAGWYNCSVIDPLRLQRYSEGIQVTVEDLFQKVVLISTHGGSLVMEKEPQTLRCVAFVHKLRATHTNVTYVFLKAGQPIASSSDPVFHIASIERSNAGSYSCIARLGTTVGRSPEVRVELYEHIPKSTLTAKPPSGRVYTEDQIVLKCKLDAFVGWKYYWYKDRKETYPVEQNWGSRGDGATYIIWRASLRHTGWYWCRAGRGSPIFYTDYSKPLFINVTELFTSVGLTVSPGTVLRKGQPLQLMCEAQLSERQKALPPSAATVRILFTFWRNGEPLGSSLDLATYSISEMLSCHAGRYVCSVSSGRAEKRSREVLITLVDVTVTLTAVLGAVLLIVMVSVALAIKIWWLRAQRHRAGSPGGATLQAELMEPVDVRLTSIPLTAAGGGISNVSPGNSSSVPLQRM